MVLDRVLVMSVVSAALALGGLGGCGSESNSGGISVGGGGAGGGDQNRNPEEQPLEEEELPPPPPEPIYRDGKMYDPETGEEMGDA